LNGLAAAEMDAARDLLDVPASPVFAFNAGVATEWGGGASYSPPVKPSVQALRAARSDYIAALHAALRTKTGNRQDWWSLETALVDTVYFEYAHPDLYPFQMHFGVQSPAAKEFIGETGARILQSRVLDGVNFRVSPMEIATAVLELADWHMAHSAFDYAYREYGASRELLVQANVAQEAIDEMLSPSVPAVVPAVPARISGVPRDGALGYLDVSVEINRFGAVRRSTTVGKSPGVSKAVEKAFKTYLAWVRFRPRFVMGELARTDRFDARFYFD
jgi:hypothetical protein